MSHGSARIFTDMINPKLEKTFAILYFQHPKIVRHFNAGRERLSDMRPTGTNVLIYLASRMNILDDLSGLIASRGSTVFIRDFNFLWT